MMFSFVNNNHVIFHLKTNHNILQTINLIERLNGMEIEFFFVLKATGFGRTDRPNHRRKISRCYSLKSVCGYS